MKRIIFVLTIIILLSSNILFWISFHNNDLLHNYSVIYSQVNRENCDNYYIELIDIIDCTAIDKCYTYQEIYKISVILKILSYYMLVGIILFFVIQNGTSK